MRLYFSNILLLIIFGANLSAQSFWTDYNAGLSHLVITETINLNGTTLDVSDKILDFQGGGFQNGTLHCSETIFSNANGCLATNVLISGAPKNATVEVDWWEVKKITLEQYLQRVNNLSSPNSTILSNILRNGSIKNIRFGNGIYYFPQTCIPNPFTGIGLHIFGCGVYATCLYFPNSVGFHLHTGNLASSQFSDLFIYSYEECFKLRMDNANQRFNSLEHNEFNNLVLLSENGNYCFGADKDYASFMYDNHFHRVGFICKNDAAGFKNLSGLGTTYDMIEDQHWEFSGSVFSESFKATHGKSSVFEACRNVHITNSNIGFMGPKHLYYYNSSDSDRKEGINILSDNCNFEGFTDSFIKIAGDYAGIDRITFTNCAFVSDIPSENIAAYNHFILRKVRHLAGIPKSIYNIADNQFHPTLITSYYISEITSTNRKIKHDTTRYYVLDTDRTDGSIPGGAPRIEVRNANDSVLYTYYNYYYLPGKETVTVSESILSKFRKAEPLIYNFASVQDAKMTPEEAIRDSLDGRPLFIRFEAAGDTCATSVDFKRLFCTGTPSWGNYTQLLPVVLFNASNVNVIVYSGENQTTLFPSCYKTLLGNQFLWQPLRIDKFSCTTLTDVETNREYQINGQSFICVDKGCGLYCNATPPPANTYIAFHETDALTPLISVFTANGHIYMVRGSGTFSSLDKSYYPTNTDTTFQDGTVTLVCLGPAPSMVLKSGTTEERPSNAPIGFNFFDTTLNRPVWKTFGNLWFDPQKIENDK